MENKKIILLLSGIILFLISFNFIFATTDGMLVYRGGGDTSIPEYKTWNGSTWGVEGTALDITAVITYVKIVANPDNLSNEKILCTGDGGRDTNCQIWNGASWGNLNEFSTTNGGDRAFDIAYLNSSSAMVCYRAPTDTSIPYCDIWNGLTWTGNDAADVTGVINTLKLIDDPNSNYAALVTKDGSGDINVQIFNGITWNNLTEVEDDAGACTACFLYDGAWTSSGDFMLTWFSNADDEIEARNFTKSAGWGGQMDGVISSLSGANQVVELKANPNPVKNELLLATADGNDDVKYNFWNGTSWKINETLNASIGVVAATNHPLSLAYEQSGNYQAVIAYGITANAIKFRSWNGSNWTTEGTFPALGENLDWMQMDSNLNNENIMLTTLGIATRVDTIEWNGSNWTGTWVSQEILSADASWNAWFTYGGEVLGNSPVISNITSSHAVIKSGNTITFYANSSTNGVNDSDLDILNLYCDSTNTPNAINTDCTGGVTSSAYTYNLSCSFATALTDLNNTEYCRVYDGSTYSSVVSINYTTDSSPPVTSVTSVAYDNSPSYFDILNDGRTDIIVAGEASMSCRWSSSDVSYSGMSNICTIIGINANCSINDVLSQGVYNRYVACQDNLTNEQNSSNNLNVQFYLDYTAPTTTDNGTNAYRTPNYSLSILESDNVDSDPTSYYCTSSIEGCAPNNLIDTGGSITYDSSNRGTNYLRYYSIDDAGNNQTVVNKTININRRPIFSSAVDDANIIKGGASVNISTISYDLDSGQDMTLWICNTNSINYTGCSSSTHCIANGSSNLTCIFSSEVDSANHTWYAFIYDELNEIAITNFSGSYTTDSTNATITLISPTNNTIITQGSVTFTILVNEALTNAWYNLNNGENISYSNSSLYIYTNSNTSIADGQYNLTIWANDSVGNINYLSGNGFTINTAVPDTSAPIITINSPSNNTYYTSSSILLNISGDENLSWAGYTLNGGSFVNLDNYSVTNWNATISFTEGQHNVSFYANDTSNNTGNNNVTFFVDLTNPAVDYFFCNNANDSQDIICNANLSDFVGLDYAIVGNNGTGDWANSSNIILSGNFSSISSSISASNTSVPGLSARIYVYDNSGRLNGTTVININISDEIPPTWYNFSYYPNSTKDLDPGVNISFNVTVLDNYNVSFVNLMYKNSSDVSWNTVVMHNITGIVYHASRVFQNGTWYVKVNSTDSYANENLSSQYVFDVAYDLNSTITTNIPAVKSLTYAQRLQNNSLGNLILNNSGDIDLNFNITLNSSLGSRLSINDTLSMNASYFVASNHSVNLTILVNTTSLTAGIYYYNITISSETGIQVLEKQLNIQTSDGPYLVVSISSYSSSLTSGQTGVELISTITNLGTADANNVYLNWSLPSAFSLTSGLLSRSLGSLPIGSSSTNSITISVLSSASGIVNLSSIGSASNADSSTDNKTITITQPITVTQTVTSTTTAGGGGGGSIVGGGISTPVYEETVEVLRGETNSFEIEVVNKYFNSTLKNLILSISGYPTKYVTIIPSQINELGPGKSYKFKVVITSPIYTEYQELPLVGIITGDLISNEGSKVSYNEEHKVLLIITEVTKEQANNKIIIAEKAIEELKAKGYNTFNLEKQLVNAKQDLVDKKYKLAKIGAENVLALKQKSENVDNLLRRVLTAAQDPKQNYLLIGDVTKSFEKESSSPLRELLLGPSLFLSADVRDAVDLAIVAFERGDYVLAEERANKALQMLILERKGNPLLFIYLYWHYIILSFILVSLIGVIGYRKMRVINIHSKIEDSLIEEEQISKLSKQNQIDYFKKTLSPEDYRARRNNYEDRRAELKKNRLELRNKRIKLLKAEEIIPNLDKEKHNIEKEIKTLQELFYKEGKISKEEYEKEFTEFNDRVAEIEDERVTLQVTQEKGKKKSLVHHIKDFFEKQRLKKDEKLKDKIKVLLEKNEKKIIY